MSVAGGSPGDSHIHSQVPHCLTATAQPRVQGLQAGLLAGIFPTVSEDAELSSEQLSYLSRMVCALGRLFQL